MNWDVEEEETVHISFRILAPYYESESVDVALTFPLEANDVLGLCSQHGQDSHRCVAYACGLYPPAAQ